MRGHIDHSISRTEKRYLKGNIRQQIAEIDTKSLFLFSLTSWEKLHSIKKAFKMLGSILESPGRREAATLRRPSFLCPSDGLL